MSKGRQGAELAELGQLVAGGAVAFTDDGAPVASADLMRRALQYATMFDRVIMQHCQVPELTVGGVMHEGVESMRLGLGGMPAAAEDIMVARDIRLAEMLIRARAHPEAEALASPQTRLKALLAA